MPTDPEPAQLTFALPVREALGRGDFLVSEANAAAVAAISDHAARPGGKLALIGPEASGKTHLVHVWAAETGAAVIAAADLGAADIAGLARSGAVAVEDADRIGGDPGAEAALFHLHNLLQAEGGRLLVTGRSAPARWPIALPDLKSRLDSAATATLGAPDDALLGSVIVKHFADRQVAVSPALVGYLVARIERSFAAAHAIVRRLDAAALAEGRPVTRALAQRVLDTPPDDPA